MKIVREGLKPRLRTNFLEGDRVIINDKCANKAVIGEKGTVLADPEGSFIGLRLDKGDIMDFRPTSLTRIKDHIQEGLKPRKFKPDIRIEDINGIIDDKWKSKIYIISEDIRRKFDRIGFSINDDIILSNSSVWAWERYCDEHDITYVLVDKISEGLKPKKYIEPDVRIEYYREHSYRSKIYVISERAINYFDKSGFIVNDGIMYSGATVEQWTEYLEKRNFTYELI
jgi:hypothetical protein